MGLPDPHYQTSVAGPEYALEFTARAILGDGGEVIGVGTGSSKRKAQLAAAESAVHSISAVVLRNHLETCVVEQIERGNVEIIDEVMNLLKKFSR